MKKKASVPSATPLENHTDKVTGFDEKQKARSNLYDWLLKMPIPRGGIDGFIDLAIKLPIRDVMHIATAATAAGLPVQATLNEILARDAVATAIHEECERHIAFGEGDRPPFVLKPPQPNGLAPKTVGEWATMLPKGNDDETQTAPVNLTMSAGKWGQLAHGAARLGMSVEELLNRIMQESCEFWNYIHDMTNSPAGTLQFTPRRSGGAFVYDHLHTRPGAQSLDGGHAAFDNDLMKPVVQSPDREPDNGKLDAEKLILNTGLSFPVEFFHSPT